MIIEPFVGNDWENLQDKYNYSVDILGRPIDYIDQDAFYMCLANGLNSFLQKDCSEKHINSIGILENLLSPKR